MVAQQVQSRRAKSYEEIEPLVKLCKDGRLFDVQKWIDEGGPLDLPEVSSNRCRKMSPLAFAIDRGFHSMVQVLLWGGASVKPYGTYCPIKASLTKRRLDLVKLLVEGGYDAKNVDMNAVFATWDPEIMEYFIDRGADVEEDMPLAIALCNRVRTALPVFKKYRERFASFQEQANIALRHHCREGNLKWVSLMLWAGADPLEPGEAEPNRVPDSDEKGISALSFAALYDHYEVFELKGISVPVDHPAARELLHYACTPNGMPLVVKLIGNGLAPNDQENGGCSVIQSLLASLGLYRRLASWSLHFSDAGGDSGVARERMKMLHLLAKHGGKWRPKDQGDMNAARRALAKMAPDYTLEFAWIMASYAACRKEDIETLVKTPTMRRALGRDLRRLQEILDSWPVFQEVGLAD